MDRIVALAILSRGIDENAAIEGVRLKPFFQRVEHGE